MYSPPPALTGLQPAVYNKPRAAPQLCKVLHKAESQRFPWKQQSPGKELNMRGALGSYRTCCRVLRVVLPQLGAASPSAHIREKWPHVAPEEAQVGY